MRPRRRRRQCSIGVDLGGTWVRVIALDARDRRRAFKGPSPGLGGLPALLRRLCRRWTLEHDDVRRLVVASKGVWTAAERRRQARRLRALARRVRVISDVEAAHLGALGERAGVLLLAGTGSMALGRDARGRWARAARGGSREAHRIVARSQDALADLLVRLSRELHLRSPVPVSWAGGLLENPRFRAGVWRAARRAGIRVKPQPPRESPSMAVAHLANLQAVQGIDRAHSARVPPRSRPTQ